MQEIKTNTSLYSIMSAALRLFYKLKKKQFYILLAVTFSGSIFEVVSLSAIVPVIYFIDNPSPILTNKFTAYIYHAFHFSSTGRFILVLLFGLVILFVIKNLYLLWTVYFQNKFFYRISQLLIEHQIFKFYKTNYLNIKSNNSIEYLRALTIAPQEFASSLMLPMVLIFNEVLVVIMLIILLFSFYPKILLLLFISIVPVCVILIRISHKRLIDISNIKAELENKSYRVTLEGINAYTDIKLFGKELSFLNTLETVFGKLFDANTKTNLYHWVPRRIIEVVIILTICLLYAIVLFFFGTSVNEIILILITFATAAYRLLPSANEILVNIIRIKTSQHVLDQLSFYDDYSVVEKKSEKDNTLLPLDFNKNIQLNNIVFKYKMAESTVLTNLDLDINKGDYIVITGDSGSGKSTIGKILCGFIYPDSGIYRIDNLRVRAFNDIKHLVGYVTQDFFLFDKSLLENIAILENPDEIDLNKINKVLEATNLSDFVYSLPNGIYHQIGERGQNLSGGQKQRIAIARALYKDIQLLILDEPTNSLDNENEIKLLDTIYNISKNNNLTVILITHHTAAIKKFDKIYELRNGYLIEQKLN